MRNLQDYKGEGEGSQRALLGKFHLLQHVHVFNVHCAPVMTGGVLSAGNVAPEKQRLCPHSLYPSVTHAEI